MSIELILGIPLIITITFILSHFLLRYIYDYQLTDDAIEVVLFTFLPIYKIPYSKITAIKECSLLESIFSYSLGNRLFGKLVLVQKNNGIFRRIVFTPSDSDKFISTVLKER